MQQNTIELIYHGLTLGSLTHHIPYDRDYEVESRRCERLESELRARLSPKQWKKFAACAAQQKYLSQMENTQAYVEGFRTAMNLCVESLDRD